MYNSHSDKFIYIFFSCLQRKQNEEIFYDIENHDILHRVQGYFSSLISENQEIENRRLSQRIIDREPMDTVIDGKHLLIPQLSLNEFLNEFITQSNNENSIEQLINTFKADLNHNTDDITFSSEIFNLFFNKLIEQNENLNFDVEELKLIVDKTIKSISLKNIESMKKW